MTRRDELRRGVPGHYRGWLHLSFTLSASVATAGLLLSRVRGLRAWEISAAPLFFLLCALGEYLEHRYLLHRRTRLAAAAFRIHTIEHHSFFTEADFAPESRRDWAFVLFPPTLVLAYMLLLVPLFTAAGWFAVAPNVGLLVGATGAFFFLCYEVIHLASHLGERMPAPWLFRRLGEHHRIHHRTELMTERNFNVVCPLFDWLFGTLERPP